MKIPEFIEKAIAGGWNTKWETINAASFPHGYSDIKVDYADTIALRRTRRDGTEGRWMSVAVTFHEMLLDPLAWQAVGKVEGWQNKCDSSYGCDGNLVPATGTGKVVFPYQCDKCHGYVMHSAGNSPWFRNMHRMIDALAEGKSIEEFLETL